MAEFLTRLKQRKLVQWAVAYLAIAFALLQAAQLLSETYAWPPVIMRTLPVMLGTGIVITLVLAWYHGERGHQRAGRTEVVLLAVVCLLGGIASWSTAQSDLSRRNDHVAMGDKSTDIRLVVLPFENLGDSASGLMAAGISDQIRGKLSRLPILTVLARETSLASAKLPVQDLGDTLDVQYVLMGTVRSTPAANGSPARIQVSPELVRVSDSRSKPVTRWQQEYVEEMTDVFDVQNKIAQRVATEMNVELGAKDAAALNERPTKSLAAWEEYNARAVTPLPGEAVADRWRRAASHAQRATELDPAFAEAWKALASLSGLAQFYIDRGNVRGTDAERSRIAADRAMQLDSAFWGPKARAEYLQWAVEDYAGSAELYRRLLKQYPNDAETLTGLCITQQFLGAWLEAASACERAASVDPKSITALGRGAQSFAILGDRKRALDLVVQHRKALLSDSAAQSWPEDLEVNVREALGDYAGAQAVLDRALLDKRSGDRTLLNAFPHRWQVFKPEHLRRVTEVIDTTTPEAGAQPMNKAVALFALGDTVNARRAAEAAMRVVQTDYKALTSSRSKAYNRLNLAIGLAILGRFEQAIQYGEQTRELMPIDSEGVNAARTHRSVAWIYMLAGKPEKAIDVLTPILSKQRNITAASLRADPRFAALHGNPRFDRLFRR